MALGKKIIYNHYRMNTTTIPHSTPSVPDGLMALRQRAQELIAKTESEEMLAEAVGILSGKPLPCAYSMEQMEMSLRVAEEDYRNGNCVDHETLRQQYGL